MGVPLADVDDILANVGRQDEKRLFATADAEPCLLYTSDAADD